MIDKINWPDGMSRLQKRLVSEMAVNLGSYLVRSQRHRAYVLRNNFGQAIGMYSTCVVRRLAQRGIITGENGVLELKKQSE